MLIIAENNPLNDYPDEASEEEDEEVEDSECESEEREHGNATDEPSEEDLEHKGFSKDDPLFDEEFDDYDDVGSYDVEDVNDEDWRWSHR